VDFGEVGMSAVYRRYKSGPRTLPCGTPASITIWYGQNPQAMNHENRSPIKQAPRSKKFYTIMSITLMPISNIQSGIRCSS
jgi:hypothetical protein